MRFFVGFFRALFCSISLGLGDTFSSTCRVKINYEGKNVKCICMCILCVCVYVHMCVCTHNMYVRICMTVCMYVCMYVSVHVYVHVCMYACVHVFMQT